MNTIKVKLANLTSAPWRFSEDQALRHQYSRNYSSILENVVRSIQTEGQIAPIHVRPLGGAYEIVDGHIVVDAATLRGLLDLEAIVHELNDEQARLLYIHFNLNRCGQYGHYHVKIHRVFGDIAGADAKEKAKMIAEHCNWPPSRILDYVELDERSDNWRRFMFVTGKSEDEKQSSIFGSDEDEDKVPDWR